MVSLLTGKIVVYIEVPASGPVQIGRALNH